MKMMGNAARGLRASNLQSQRLVHTLMTATAMTMVATPAWAQSADAQQTVAPNNKANDVIIVSGIRNSLENALVEKRESNNIIEVIQAEDIGKLPDQNLAEVLENITGVQITRTAGIGSAVQIRGTGANRVEINGVSTVSAGGGRSGISFEDLPAALIASVEVIKVPTAQTIEGSVGGTINLRTLRGLSLTEPLISIRAQGEYSDLADTIQPRISATAGNSWSTSAGEFGVVVSGSYFRQDVSAFNPRFDRDRELLPTSTLSSAEAFPFLRTQFFDQDNDNFEFETLNFTGSLEYAPSDNLKFYFDATLNDQERRSESSRVQFSGTGGNAVVNATTNTAFETVNLGSLEGPNGTLNLGQIQAVLSGVLDVGVEPNGTIDPNLRTSSDTGARITKSRVFALGSEWENDRVTLRAEGAISTSNSRFPNFSTTLDFINPLGPQPVIGRSLDNGIPIAFDASGGTLQFGIAPGLPFSPTTEQLLDPANYALRQVVQSDNQSRNREAALRFDLSYDTSDIAPFITSIDSGYRFNRNNSRRDNSTDNVNLTNATTAFNRPRANLFSDITVPGPSNFDRADGRTLFVRDFLLIDPALSFSDPAAVLASLNSAITANNAATTGRDIALLDVPTEAVGAFFDIEETTHAAYLQANFETDTLGFPIRGNAGVRYVDTSISSVGNNVINGVVTQVTENSSYNFFLPRFNLVLEPADKLLVRGGIARDIRRPDFDNLSTSITFPNGANAPVEVGNPALIPEVVWSYDLSAEYYFSPSSILSVGFFHKSRTNLFANATENPDEPRSATGQIERDITAPCEGGGIFNPIADRNVQSSIQGVGICVPLQSTFNVAGTTTQTGLEVAFQYDLSAFEDKLGWASGFGFIGNATFQDTGGSASEFRFGNGDANALNLLLGRTDTTQATPTLDDDVVQERVGLFDLSKFSYNATLFYDKYGINFRARYTFRSDFQVDNFVSFDLPRIVGDRGQLNTSLNYAFNDNITIGVDAINLLKTDRPEFCVNDNALLCAQGLTDRRIVAGANIKF